MALMQRAKAARRVLVAGGLDALLSACLPESRLPLTPADEAIDVAELVGTWQTTFQGAPVLVEVTSSKSKRLEIATTLQAADGTLEVRRFIGHVAGIGGRNFLNLQDAAELAADKWARWWFLGYASSADGSVTLRVPAAAAMTEAIVRGFSGEVENDGIERRVRLIDNVAPYLAKADPATLFDETLILTRQSAQENAP